MPRELLLSLLEEAPGSFQGSAGGEGGGSGEAKTPSGRGSLWEGLASVGPGPSCGQDLGPEEPATWPWLLPSLDPTGMTHPNTPEPLLPSLQYTSQIQLVFMHFSRAKVSVITQS